MEEFEKEVKKQLKRNLKGITSPTVEGLIKRLRLLPRDRITLTIDLAISIAAVNLKAAVEMLRAAPDASRLVDAGDLRVWGEIGKRLSATSADSAVSFFQTSPSTLESLSAESRSAVLRLVNKQSALSAGTALESFRASPGILLAMGSGAHARQILEICLELARHSVKHSNDLFSAAPRVLAQMESASGRDNKGQTRLVERALNLTSSFAFRSGGTAAEFFSELPGIVTSGDFSSIEKLFDMTETYLDRSGGVALQYFKAAGRVLSTAGRESFERWTALARRVALQGNAASYHFMKQSPQIVSDLAARVPPGRRSSVVNAVLELVDEIAEKNTSAAVECFKASSLALSASSLGQFRDWARRGLDQSGDNPRRIQAYYSLESKASQEALFRVEGGLTLEAVAHTLRLYVEGLTGRSLHIASLAAIPDESKIGDGSTVYLPSVVAEFEDEAENFRLFKVLAAHGAGQIEFGTYAEDHAAIVAAMDEIRTAFANRRRDSSVGRDQSSAAGKKKRKEKTESALGFTRALAEFPAADLALRLFTTIENGRVDYLLRRKYRGIRRDLDFVRGRLRDRRPEIDKIPPELIPFELLFQIAICGGPTEQTRLAFPTLLNQLETVLATYIFRDDADVSDSLIATRHIYDLFTERPAQSDSASSEAGEQIEGDDSQAGDGAPSDQMSESQKQQQLEVTEDPFSLWSSAHNLDATNSEQDLFSRLRGADSPEADLEKGDRAFYYDEWDRELSDYRTRWCRVIERAGSRGSRGFVELVRSRYSGVISSIRYQFQLLRPENLRKIRGEIDGEDYDLQSVIDYALDKRSTGLIDDRLYTRKLRRERDVAVSFLLDMSSSTARTISRFPNHPYTQPGQRIIDIEKEGLVLMSEALEAVGDAYSIQGFTSEGRRNVKFYVIKDFDDGYSVDVERRIGGINYQNNTRLGAAIRHAMTRLAAQDARTKLLIVLSDGRPYDHDYGDSRYAREDTRMALRQARVENITPFCITIDRESEDQLRDMYGEVGYTIIDDVLSLPERLPGIYRRLTT
jgi:nitric oxide reductase NorD protein